MQQPICPQIDSTRAMRAEEGKAAELAKQNRTLKDQLEAQEEDLKQQKK